MSSREQQQVTDSMHKINLFFEVYHKRVKSMKSLVDQIKGLQRADVSLMELRSEILDSIKEEVEMKILREIKALATEIEDLAEISFTLTKLRATNQHFPPVMNGLVTNLYNMIRTLIPLLKYPLASVTLADLNSFEDLFPKEIEIIQKDFLYLTSETQL